MGAAQNEFNMKEDFLIHKKLSSASFLVLGHVEISGTDYADIEKKAKELLKAGTNGELSSIATWNNMAKSHGIDYDGLFFENPRVRISRNRITKKT